MSTMVRLASDCLRDWGAAERRASRRRSTCSRISQCASARSSWRPQTELRLGHVGLRRSHPDYFDVVVMNAILGGVFTPYQPEPSRAERLHVWRVLVLRMAS
jgi:hypothetical protein